MGNTPVNGQRSTAGGSPVPSGQKYRYGHHWHPSFLAGNCSSLSQMRRFSTRAFSFSSSCSRSFSSQEEQSWRKWSRAQATFCPGYRISAARA